MPTPEERAREIIDQMLTAAGWAVQDLVQLNLGAGLGVAVREFQTASGPADYVLFVERKAVGVVEAKPEGTTLRGVFEQSAKYMTSFPADIPHVELPLPFSYESTGLETLFVDLRDPDYRSRRVFHFHQPETLQEWLTPPQPSPPPGGGSAPTLRGRLREMPEAYPLITDGLWDAQIEAITSLEGSFAANKPRALIQMATGSGKTFTAVSFIYRLIRHAGAKRVLFLVDRNNLGKQTLREFQSFRTPDDGRLFTELYNVQRLTSNAIDPVCKVTITTIQRLYSMLKGEQEYEETNEEMSWFEQNIALTPSPSPAGRGESDSLSQWERVGVREREVAYNPEIPIESFDFIITDECHRSIYNLWRQVLEYFDAFLIGLTATPSKHTLGFFEQNLVTEYTHERAVADGVNVGYEVYRIRTRITTEGETVEAGHYVDRRDKQTRAVRWEQLDEDLDYTPGQLDRAVVAVDQIRTVVRAFRDRLATEIFPGREEVPKTLVFAKDDSHAEDIVEVIRQEFGKGNEFCKKITYRTTGEKPEDLIASFRNAYYPRIAVTVDMISTGTDIKPLECLLFLRMIRSQGYLGQMNGRGTRVISDTGLTAVTPDAGHKTHFVIVDAVGVCEMDKTDTRPLERKKSVPFDRLLQRVAMDVRDVDSLESLAGRLARLDRRITPEESRSIQTHSGGIPLKGLVHALLDAVDPDVHLEYAQTELGGTTPEQIQKAQDQLIQKACAPFDNADLRAILIDIQQRSEQVIDTISKDAIVEIGFAEDEARRKVASFREFIEAHKNELTALQILYSQPYGGRRLTFQAVQELAEAIKLPPYHLTPEELWRAYEALDKARVRRAGPGRLLTDIIALVRYALEQSQTLEPFPLTVEERYKNWILDQQEAGREFSGEQLAWLEMIKAHIAASVTIEMDDFEEVPFNQKGGAIRVYELFGAELEAMLAELNRELTK